MEKQKTDLFGFKTFNGLQELSDSNSLSGTSRLHFWMDATSLVDTDGSKDFWKKKKIENYQ